MTKQIKYLIIAFFCMSLNIALGQISLTVNYLSNEGYPFKDVTSNCEIWISDNLEGKSKIALNLANGVFKIDSLPVDCPYFHIRDHNGEMHTQKLCMGLKHQSEWKIYVGSSDCLYHFGGHQPEPFFPEYDKIYLAYNLAHEGFVNKLDSLGLSVVGSNVFKFNPNRREEIIKELVDTEGVYTLAPIYRFTRTGTSYFTANISVLLKNELTEEETEKLCKYLDIDKITKVELSSYSSSIWRGFRSGVFYFIKPKKKAWDYSFLNKLNELLLKNENMLVIKTEATVIVKDD